MSSLAEEFPKQQARCREALKRYLEIPAGAFGAAMIEQTLQRADKAAAGDDIIAMLQSYEEMKEVKE